MFLLLLFAVGPACTQSPAEDEALAKLEALERQLEQGRELEKDLPALEAEIAAVEATVEELGAVLVSDEADALARLRATLERSGFSVVDLRSRGESVVEGLRVVRFDVEAVTPFAASSKAFEALSVQPLIVLVEELSMKRDGERARLSFIARLGLASDPPG
jgi:hypothetical protein